MASKPVAPMDFTAEIKLDGINPYVMVSAARARRIQRDWKRPMPVLLQVNGKPDPPWRVNMMPVGEGRFHLHLAGAVRKACGVQVGDRVTISARFDETYRSGPQHEVPHELAAGLGGDAAARSRWESLAPSLQKEILCYLSRLKSEQARRRNIDLALRALSGQRVRFLARDWN
jgi:hypothetical protein